MSIQLICLQRSVHCSIRSSSSERKASTLRSGSSGNTSSRFTGGKLATSSANGSPPALLLSTSSENLSNSLSSSVSLEILRTALYYACSSSLSILSWVVLVKSSACRASVRADSLRYCNCSSSFIMYSSFCSCRSVGGLGSSFECCFMICAFRGLSGY